MDSPQKKTKTAQAGSSYCVENAMQPSAGELKLQFAVKARPRYRSLVPAAILKKFPSTRDSRSVAASSNSRGTSIETFLSPAFVQGGIIGEVRSCPPENSLMK